jgi:hypothetical protein
MRFDWMEYRTGERFTSFGIVRDAHVTASGTTESVTGRKPLLHNHATVAQW